MKGWQHLTFAAVSAGVMCIIGPKCVGEVPTEALTDTPPIIFAASGLATMLGSLLPDIDCRTSYLGRRLPFISGLFPKHRGITHSIGHFLIVSAILMAVGMFAPIPKIASFAIYGLLYGYLTHLFLDLFSKEGIPLFWRKKNYKENTLTGLSHDGNKKIRLFNVSGIFSLIWLIILIAVTAEPLNRLFQIILPILY